MEKTFEPVVACPQQLPVHRSAGIQAGVRQTACRCPHTAAHGRIPKRKKQREYIRTTYLCGLKNHISKINSDTTRLKWGYIFLLTRLGWRADLIHTLM